MLETLLRPGRNVAPNDKILFDDTISCRIIFANEGTTPALIPDGTRIQMTTPLIMVGGRLEMTSSETAIARYLHGVLIFENGYAIEMHKLRGGNWGVVLGW